MAKASAIKGPVDIADIINLINAGPTTFEDAYKQQQSINANDLAIQQNEIALANAQKKLDEENAISDAVKKLPKISEVKDGESGPSFTPQDQADAIAQIYLQNGDPSSALNYQYKQALLGSKDTASKLKELQILQNLANTPNAVNVYNQGLGKEYGQVDNADAFAKSQIVSGPHGSKYKVQGKSVDEIIKSAIPGGDETKGRVIMVSPDGKFQAVKKGSQDQLDLLNQGWNTTTGKKERENPFAKLLNPDASPAPTPTPAPRVIRISPAGALAR